MSIHQLDIPTRRREAVAQSDADALGDALNTSGLNVWISEVSGHVDICLKEERWGESAFWGQVLSDLLERRHHIAMGDPPGREVRTYEDSMNRQRWNKLQRLVERDEEAGLADAARLRSRNTMQNARRSMFSCFGDRRV